MSQPEENREKSAKTDVVLSPRAERHTPATRPHNTGARVPEDASGQRRGGVAEPASPGEEQ